MRGESAHEVVDRTRRVDVSDDELHIHGTCDVLNDDELVEYKSSRPGKTPVVRDHHIAQLAAYHHCAKASGVNVSRASIWFTDQKRRISVDSEDLGRFDIPALANQVKDVLRSPISPPVLEDDPRCSGCSLIEVCQPSAKLVCNPRIVVPKASSQLLYVTSIMTRVSLRKGQIHIELSEGSPLNYPMDKVSGMVVLNDRALITTPLIVALLGGGKCVTYTRFGSIPIGYAAPSSLRNGVVRQEIARLDADKRAYLAAEMIRAKIHNQAARVGVSDSAKAASAILRRQRDLLKPSVLRRVPIERRVDAIFGAEGGAAHAYFSVFFTELPEWTRNCGSTLRVGRGAYDPVNVLLNYAYSMLHGAVMRAILACGLDPAAGVLHSPSRNKPALVLDIGEQFRAPLADATVRQLLNNRVITQESFVEKRGRFGMSKECRTALIGAFTDKLADTHNYLPGAYEMSWERSIEYQVRALLRYVDGTSSEWKGLYVR